MEPLTLRPEERALLRRHRAAIKAYGENAAARLPPEVHALCCRLGLLTTSSNPSPQCHLTPLYDAAASLPAALVANGRVAAQRVCHGGFDAPARKELPPAAHAFFLAEDLVRATETTSSAPCSPAPPLDGVRGYEWRGGRLVPPARHRVSPVAHELFLIAALEHRLHLKSFPMQFLRPEFLARWCGTAERAATAHASRSLASAPILRSEDLLSFTFVQTWCGDDASTTMAALFVCTATALEGLKCALADALRPHQQGRHCRLLEVLEELRRSPDRAGLWDEASGALLTLCYGPRAEDVTSLRAKLMRTLWTEIAGCRRCQARRIQDDNLCLGCLSHSMPERLHVSEAAIPKQLTAHAGLVLLGQGGAEALWELEQRCLHTALVSRAPPFRVAPLLRLLTYLRDNDKKARLLGERRASSDILRAELHLQRQHPLVPFGRAPGASALTKLAKDRTLKLGAIAAPAVRMPALVAALKGQGSPRVAAELEMLRLLGAREPRHAQQLLLGGALSSESLQEAREDLNALLRDPALARKAWLRRAFQSAKWPQQIAGREATALRRSVVPLVLAAQTTLERAEEAGAWGFRACLDRLKPRVRQHLAAGTDDDWRPRPAPLLTHGSNAASAETGAWTVATFFEDAPILSLRARRSLEAARAADASKVAKSWAPPCLHPCLEAPAEVPHRGPHSWDHVPIGRSRLFYWRPRSDERILCEELAQMESILEAMEPQEHWIQTTGVMKKNAVFSTRALRQINGHLAGASVTSPFCTTCSTPEAPIAAMWCPCTTPTRDQCPAVLRENWHLPAAYHATASWRSGQAPASSGGARRLLFSGPLVLPLAPEQPSMDEFQLLVQEARRAAKECRVFVACAGVWWDTNGRAVSKGGLELAAGCKAFVKPGSTPTRRRLDMHFRRCDDERLLLWCHECTPVYTEATRCSLGRRAHPQVRLRRLPLVHRDSGAWEEPPVSICVGTTLHEAPPPAPGVVEDREGKSKLRKVIERSEATLFEKRLLFLPRHCTKRARHGTAPLPDESVRNSLCISGLRVAEERCAACLAPADDSRPAGSPCAVCGSSQRPWLCACGAARHLAITTTQGTEDWLCVKCLSLSGRADSFADSFVRSANAPYTVDLRAGHAHPALAAGWASRISALLPREHWARMRHDGRTLDSTCSPEKLASCTSQRSTRLQLGHRGQTLFAAAPEVLRLWPVSSIQNDRRAAAAILGQAEARSTGTLLQQLMTPAALEDARRLTPLQTAASVTGGFTTL